MLSCSPYGQMAPTLLKNYFVVFWVVTRYSLPAGYREFRRSFLPLSSEYPALGCVKCQDSRLLDSFVLLRCCLPWGNFP